MLIDLQKFFGTTKFPTATLVFKKIGSKSNGKIYCKVKNGGVVKSHKGVNLPDSTITFPIITAKDVEDLKFGLKQGVDSVALSFVRDAKDINKLKKLILKFLPKGKRAPKIIAKIERKEALVNFDKILICVIS